jgi:hypothetical protein
MGIEDRDYYREHAKQRDRETRQPQRPAQRQHSASVPGVGQRSSSGPSWHTFWTGVLFALVVGMLVMYAILRR